MEVGRDVTGCPPVAWQRLGHSDEVMRDLMERMGHDSARAALIYQHKSAAAGQVIADALSAQIETLWQDRGDGPATG